MIRFALLFEKFKFRKKIAAVAEPDLVPLVKEVATDLSLRANGSSYLQRADEAETIAGRIENSSSAVIGIGGVRGAGKSSLALKVLQDCKEKGYFTIMIPSPSAYDPKEFLLTIYQNIAERLRLQLVEKLDNPETFEVQTAQELKRSKFRMMVILLGAGMLLCYTMLIFMNIYAIELSKSHYTYQQRKLTWRVDSVQEYSSFYPQRSNLGVMQGRPDSSARYKSFNSQRFRRDSIDLAAVTKKTEAFDKAESFPNVLFPTLNGQYSTRLPLYGSLFFVLAILITRVLLTIRKRYRLEMTRLIKYPNHRILYKRTLKKLEWLVYQSKITTNTDFNVPLSGWSAKFSRGSQLEARPLSMPGITADFNLFMEDVTKAYPKAVICIDELDKIAKEEELESLLKGIKGIIGQQNTYYLLTVSEDAISKFSTRFRKERDLLESSFEEIYLLDRVSLELGKKIMLGERYEALKDDFAVSLNCLMVWVFANGIPREIKRNLIVLDRVKVKLAAAPKYQVWSALLFYAIDALRSWVLVNKTDETAVFNFLKSLDLTYKTVPDASLNFQQGVDWFRSLQIYFKQLFPDRTGQADQQPFVPTIYEKALFENVLLCASFLLLTLDEEQAVSTGKRIQKIFELLSYNYLYAMDELNKLLTELSISTD